MAVVSLGTPSQRPSCEVVVVPTDVCVVTGAPTSDRVVVRGSSIPGWVHLLLVLSIVGWLLVALMTSRDYRVDVAWSHRAHDRWRRIERACWAGGLVGVLGAVVAARSSGDLAGFSLLVAAVSLLLGAINRWVNAVGVSRARDGSLLLLRVDPAARAAIEAGGLTRATTSRPPAAARS